MSFNILDPRSSVPKFNAKCALTIMAKAPRAGRVKTRLTPPLTPEQAAALNACFLRDTAHNVREAGTSAGSVGIVSYTPVGDESLFDGHLPEDFTLISQRGEDFGTRLHASAEDLLACGFGSVCLIDSDSPTLPTQYLRDAVAWLCRPGDRVVLGPCHDGGYYLIGVKSAHAAPFEGIHWSTPAVYKQTAAAVRAAGLELIELPTWYDVDDGKTLQVLRQELLEAIAPSFAQTRGYAAPQTRSFLSNCPGVIR